MPEGIVIRGGGGRETPTYQWVRTDGVREKETHCHLVLNQLRSSHSLCHAMALDIFGGRLDAPQPPGGRRWLLRSRVAGSESPVSCSSPDMADGQLAPASRRMAPTSPLPLWWQPPLLDSGARQQALRSTCSSIDPATPASGSHWRSPLLPAARSPSAPRSPSAARALWQHVPPFLRVSAPM